MESTKKSFANGNGPADLKRLQQVYGGWPNPNVSSWTLTGWETPA